MAFIFWAEDIIKGTRINSFYKEYVEYAGLDKNSLHEIQQFKLNKLIRHLWSEIPWYNKKLRDIGYVPELKLSVKDLKILPPLTRIDIQENQEQLLWENYSGKVFKGSSSGTTGIPIKYYQDINGFSSGVATAYTLMQLSGWFPGIHSVHIWGNNESVKQWNRLSSKIKQRVYSRRNIVSSIINDPEKINKVIGDIIKFKPTMIDGYTNSIFELANYLKKNELKIPSVKVVFTTAENLEKEYQCLIEDVISPVSDLYGCGEINGIACKPVNDERYYIFDPHVIVETLDAEYIDTKEIVVTDLDNYYMPLIRYKVGDLIDNVHPPIEGNPLPFSFFTKIYGRTSDHIILADGRKIFPVNIFGGTLYRKYSSIKRHKTIWDGTKLVFMFEIRQAIDLAALEKDIKLSLKEYDIPIEIRTTDKLLPSANGKYKYFERKIEVGCN